MAGSFNDFAENKILELIVGKTAFATPTAHVALFTVAPTDAGGGTEVTGGSYARVATTGTDWNAASLGAIDNATTITFPTATASWGTVVAFALFDAATAGNMLVWADLTTSRTVNNGDTARFSAGALDITAQ